MLVVKVTMMEGRSVEQKRALVARLTAVAARTIDWPADRVRVAIYELGPEAWGIGGETAGARRELRA